MTGWSRQRSEIRIRKLMGTVPKASISVRTFDAAELTTRRAQILAKSGKGTAFEDLIFNVAPSQAVLVDGVHVYVQLIDYEAAMLDIGQETEPGHRRVLEMLHVHYAACDSVAEEFEAQRVDYHGPRMHAVIVTPTDDERERVLKALEFADAVTRTIEEVGRTVGNGNYRTRVRIGMDSGRAVAVNSGRGNEPEPLFLGRPANYAAKLAEGDEPGIYPSSRVRALLGMGLPVQSLREERSSVLSIAHVGLAFPTHRVKAENNLVARAVQRVEARFGRDVDPPRFTFHRHEPPLRTIDFASISPGNSIRMELLSIFGDIDGFTAYVDECIRTGSVADMVANLHVIRGELAACLKEDFGGRKVRFIGDCIHGVIAEGTRNATDPGQSVRVAVASAAGMRSSFELCQDILSGIDQLGFAIGLEFGTTPISRIGLRGERSVRCCVGKAVSASEALQSDCGGDQTRLGDRALRNAPAIVSRIFDSAGTVRGLDYESFITLTSAPAIVKSGSVTAEARPYLR